MTGTPLDLTLFGPLPGAIGLLYWLLATAVLAFALWYPDRLLLKLALAALVLSRRSLPAFLLGLSLLVSACGNGPGTSRLSERQIKAQAMFAERCKVAGERIHRTVENVEGLYLLKIRPDKVNYGDQFRLDDPYGSDFGGDAYIKSFLRGFYTSPVQPATATPPRRAYSYAEAIDPKDGQRYRYTGRAEEPWQTNKSYLKGYTRFIVDRALANDSVPRYGVTYDDISTRDEREYWIAGSSLKVIDLHTNEIIAERVGYMVDWAQGSQIGGRAPWLLATQQACPRFPGRHSVAQLGQTEQFVEKVLKPSTK